MRIASVAQMKEMDRVAIEEREIPSLQLIETAASHVTEAVLEVIKGIENPKVLLVCSTGNNGGDGFACARQLMAQGIITHVILIGNLGKQTQDCSVNMKRYLETGGTVENYAGNELPDCHCIVDALFGVGLNREISGEYRELINKMNDMNCMTIACDIPSGIHGDSGEVLGVAVKADKTVTFSCVKPGLLKEPGKTLSGDIFIVDIGIPSDLLPPVR